MKSTRTVNYLVSVMQHLKNRVFIINHDPLHFLQVEWLILMIHIFFRKQAYSNKAKHLRPWGFLSFGHNFVNIGQDYFCNSFIGIWPSSHNSNGDNFFMVDE